MNTAIVTQHNHAVNSRYVAPTAEAQAAEEAKLQRQIGRNLYLRGRSISECITDEMAAGYLAEEGRCADAYWLCMMREAD